MSPSTEPRRSIIAVSIYGLLNPIPFGCFVAALIFDIIYSKTEQCTRRAAYANWRLVARHTGWAPGGWLDAASLTRYRYRNFLEPVIRPLTLR